MEKPLKIINIFIIILGVLSVIATFFSVMSYVLSIDILLSEEAASVIAFIVVAPLWIICCFALWGVSIPAIVLSFIKIFKYKVVNRFTIIALVLLLLMFLFPPISFGAIYLI